MTITLPKDSENMNPPKTMVMDMPNNEPIDLYTKTQSHELSARTQQVFTPVSTQRSIPANTQRDCCFCRSDSWDCIICAYGPIPYFRFLFCGRSNNGQCFCVCDGCCDNCCDNSRSTNTTIIVIDNGGHCHHHNTSQSSCCWNCPNCACECSDCNCPSCPDCKCPDCKCPDCSCPNCDCPDCDCNCGGCDCDCDD